MWRKLICEKSTFETDVTLSIIPISMYMYTCKTDVVTTTKGGLENKGAYVIYVYNIYRRWCYRRDHVKRYCRHRVEPLLNVQMTCTLRRASSSPNRKMAYDIYIWRVYRAAALYYIARCTGFYSFSRFFFFLSPRTSTERNREKKIPVALMRFLFLYPPIVSGG